MFKKVLSLALASAMTLSAAATAAAANKNPIYAVSSRGYAYNSELRAVDMNNPDPAFTYGDTVYYPFLNEKSENPGAGVVEAQNSLTEANVNLNAAKEAVANEKAKLEEKEKELLLAKEKEEKAAKAFEAAKAWKASSDAMAEDEGAKKQAYIDALKNYDADVIPEEYADSAVSTAETIKTTATDAKEIAEEARNSAKSSLDEAVRAEEAKKEIVKEKQEALNAALRDESIYIDDASSVKDIRIKSQWDINGDAVKKVSIVRKKASSVADLNRSYVYFAAVELKDSKSTKASDIYGTISFKKSGAFDYDDMQLKVGLTVGYPEADTNVISEDPKVFSEGSGFLGEKDDELRFSFDDNSYFTVDTDGQGSLLLYADNEYNEDMGNVYNAANLDFFNGNGASFNKIGQLHLSAAEGSFIYSVNPDGSLQKVNAKYDEYEEEFVIRTRTLGKYVISDVEIKDLRGTSNVSNPQNPAVKPSVKPGTNPQTGIIL